MNRQTHPGTGVTPRQAALLRVGDGPLCTSPWTAWPWWHWEGLSPRDTLAAGDLRGGLPGCSSAGQLSGAQGFTIHRNLCVPQVLPSFVPTDVLLSSAYP